ncbi:hypothetical protein J6590_009597 [Homalodisca vitripennis]|nr:hypothetical protein J6590_009597 [Homalodisca vitripennis]
MLCDVPKNVIGTPKSPGILFNTLAARSGGRQAAGVARIAAANAIGTNEMKYFGLTNRKILRGAVLRYHKSGRSSLKHPQVAALPGSSHSPCYGAGGRGVCESLIPENITPAPRWRPSRSGQPEGLGLLVTHLSLQQTFPPNNIIPG